MYEFHTDDEVFHARIDDGTIERVHGPARYPDATITVSEAEFLRLIGENRMFTKAIDIGAARATGDRDTLHRLGSAFRLPPRHARNFDR